MTHSFRLPSFLSFLGRSKQGGEKGVATADLDSTSAKPLLTVRTPRIEVSIPTSFVPGHHFRCCEKQGRIPTLLAAAGTEFGGTECLTSLDISQQASPRAVLKDLGGAAAVTTFGAMYALMHAPGANDGTGELMVSGETNFFFVLVDGAIELVGLYRMKGTWMLFDRPLDSSQLLLPERRVFRPAVEQ